MRQDPRSDRSLNGWLLLPATNLVLFVSDEMLLATVTQHALMTFSGVPTILAVAKQAIPKEVEGADTAIDRFRGFIEKSSDFAREEERRGFQTIFSHHLVATWAAIESSIEQTLENHLLNVPDAIDRIRASVKMPLKRISSIHSQLDASAVLRSWNTALGQSDAIDRMLAQLDCFGLSLVLETDTRRSLTEMCELRNVIMHRSGFLDRRFLDKCPWRTDTVGTPVTLSHDTMRVYFDAAGKIAVALVEAVTKSAFLR